MSSDILHPLISSTANSAPIVKPYRDALASKVRDAENLQAKVDLLHNAYEGQDCWIIATGPSATFIPTQRLRVELADKCVIAVKHAYDLFPDVVDFHVVNPCHLKDYEYGPTPPIRVGIIWPPSSDEWDARWDLSFLIPRCGYMAESACWTKDFARWELANSVDRPWGPGIMHEIGFFLPVHLGCKRIFTLGYDMEPTDAGYFYSDASAAAGYEERDTVTVPVNATGVMREWLASHGIKWYRIATTVSSLIPAPTMNFEKALT
jgi:hypothetical protein